MYAVFYECFFILDLPTTETDLNLYSHKNYHGDFSQVPSM